MRSKQEEEKELKVTFQSKKVYNCPACDTSFNKEELLSGGGRLIAGQLTDELHRLYEPSAKYGVIFPLIYQSIVCPDCWFASMESDFSLLPQDKRAKAENETEIRKKKASLIFPDVDFTENRNLMDGAASQYLTLLVMIITVNQLHLQ